MKKITLLFFSVLALTLSWNVNAQLTEGFEAGLVSLTNDTGNGVDWTINTSFFSEGAQSAHNAYASSNNNILVSGALDISGLTAPRLTFDHIAKTEGTYDFCYVEVSTDGSSWTTIGTYDEDSYSEWGTTDTTPANDWWMSEIIDLTSYISATTYIRFRLESDGTEERYGWLLDNVVVEETPTDQLDYYNLQWPGSGTITDGDGFNVYAQAYEAGLTDVDATPSAGIEAWIGYSTTDSDPSGAGWTWVAASPNSGYDFSQNNDEYTLDLDAEVGVGTYYYAARWRLNSGPFTYGGFDAGLGGADGAWDGTEDISGVLTVNPGPGSSCSDPISLTVEADCSVATPHTIDYSSATDLGTTDLSCDTTGVNTGAWFEFTAPASGSVTVNTSDSNEILVIDSCGGTEIVCNSTTATSQNVSGLTPSSTYYLAVWKDGATSGTTDVCLEEFVVPTGDVCSDPIVIGSLPYNTSDDTGNYSDDYSGSPGSTGCGTTSSYLNGDDVVYAYTAASDTSINVAMSAIGSTYSGVFVYADCADIGTTCVAGFGNGSSTADYDFDLAVTNGSTYYIVVSTWASPQSTTFTLDVTENTCTDPTVAFSVVEDCGTSGGFLIEADITDLGSATSLTISDDQGSSDQNTSSTGVVTFGPYTNGTDVILTVTNDQDGSCSVSSSALTQLDCPPANDDCSGATVLTQETGVPDAASATSNAGTIAGATDSGLPAEECNTFTGTANDDVWYAFEALTSDVNITVDDGATTIDIVIQVYSGSCGSLTNIGCADGGNPEEVQLTGLNVSETYYFRVYQYGTSSTSGKDIDVKLWTPTVLSVNDSEFNGFKYFPNPVNHALTLSAQQNIQNVAVYNIMGQEVLNSSPNTMSSEINMSALSRGTYFVRVSINGAVQNFKIIKE